MKHSIRIYGLFVLVMACVIFASGCASMGGDKNAVRIESENNLSSVRPGGSLAFTSTGREIVWKVSSTSDGTGPVAPGTIISADGILAVAGDETLANLYVISSSLKDKKKSDSKQIRVVTIGEVKVGPEGQPVVRGRTFKFSAPVTGTNNPDQNVTWKVGTNENGTGNVSAGTGIDGDGMLTVAANEASSIIYIMATSVIDPSVSNSIPASVVTPIVHGVNVNPTNSTVRIGRTLQFTANVTGVYEPSDAVTWRVSSNAAGTGSVSPGTSISSGGLLTVVENESIRTLYIIAASVVDPTKAGNTFVTVVRPSVSEVSVTAKSQSVTAGGVLQFTSVVSGPNDPDNDVKWRVSSNPEGGGQVTPGTAISNTGMLTVSANEISEYLYVFADSNFDPTKSGKASVAINIIVPIVTGVIIEGGQTVAAGQTLQFLATVTGSNNPSNAVTWKLSSSATGAGAVAAGTEINDSGLLTVSAEETAETLYITVISTADPTKSNSSAVTVTR